MDRNDYSGFFSGVVLEAQRSFHDPETSSLQAAFLARVLDPEPGARLLDVPCGDGRLALELARHGFATLGVDIAAEFVRDAQAAADREKLDARFMTHDMRDLPDAGGLGGLFDGAYCMGNSFPYFPPDGCRAFLAGMARLVRPGGVFVLETAIAAESILPDFEERTWYRAGDMEMLVENEYDAAASRMDVHYTFVSDAGREERTFSHWVLTCREILELLEEADFEPGAPWGGMDEEPFEVGSPDLIVAGVRK